MPIRSQADQRRDMVSTDQFGRPWLLTIELKTGDPTGLISPAGWDDPLGTPQKHLKVPRDQYGQATWGRLEVDFPAWIREIEVAARAWRDELWKIGAHMYKNKFNPKTADQDEYLLTLVGRLPEPKLADLKAAAAGDRTFLGLVPEPVAA